MERRRNPVIRRILAWPLRSHGREACGRVRVAGALLLAGALSFLTPVRGVTAEAKKGSTTSEATPTPATEQADEKLAAVISERIAAAEPTQYVVLLGECIGQAQKYKKKNQGAKPEENPFYRVLASCFREDMPLTLRIAVVKALTTPVPGRDPYIDGARMLLDSVGKRPEALRTAVCKGLLQVLPRAPDQFVPELTATLSGIDATRTEVDDAAFLLWTHSPSATVKSLLDGLGERARKEKDVAAHHWNLSYYLHHRAESYDAWLTYWGDHKNDPALGEPHVARRLVEKELTDAWEAVWELLRKTAFPNDSPGAYWPFLRLGFESSWPAVRAMACREVGIIAQKFVTGSVSAEHKKGLGRLLRALLGCLKEEQGRFERLSVRLEALRSVVFFRKVLAADGGPELVQILSRAATSPAQEWEFRVEAIRTAGELGLGQLRKPVLDLVLQSSAQGTLELEILTGALETLGKIGLYEAGNPNVKLQRQVTETIAQLYTRVAPLGSKEAAAFRLAAVSALGKLGRGAPGDRIDHVKEFLLGIMEQNLEKEAGRSLAYYAIRALGELRHLASLDDLEKILGKRAAYSENLVQVTVNAMWQIGSSGQAGAAAAAIVKLAGHLDSTDAKLSDVITQRVLSLCRGSISLYALLAEKLRDDGMLAAAAKILERESVKKVRQVTLVEGSLDDLRHFWRVEKVLLGAFEADEELLARCITEIENVRKLLDELKRGDEFDAAAKPELETLGVQFKRVSAKMNLVSALADGEEAAAIKHFKSLIGSGSEHMAWVATRVRASQIAGKVIEAVIGDPDVPEEIKDLLKPDEK